ncbi:UPF0598 protein CG30010-like isoform X2 [Mizuhopecten yessoensis]|uniref:UPF0598 protein CG30010-like isoform X2 n=1 Tax=Mizuhopecten yessoensis TaxID=6573 RepID=UPI000B45A109|nr:UPF0598 protein CG30010-like isoform X2 [Mizuhopecten yessoensis]
MNLSRLKSNVNKYCQPKIWCRCVHYIQGQSPEPKIREYFYFIDHQGQLFLDDSKMKNFTSCFKEKDFLAFFFKRLRLNESSRYREDFPFLSLCGRERNFIRCDDRPIVYTHIVDTPSPDDHNLLSYGGAGSSLTVQFEPQRICMLPNTGRVYHPAASALGGIGLVKSSIAIEISQNFEFENGENNPPTKFRWKGKTYTLTNELINIMNLNAEEARDLLYQQRDKS